MEELDGDEVRVSSRGRLAERDIVQVLAVIPLNVAAITLEGGVLLKGTTQKSVVLSKSLVALEENELRGFFLRNIQLR